MDKSAGEYVTLIIHRTSATSLPCAPRPPSPRVWVTARVNDCRAVLFLLFLSQSGLDDLQFFTYLSKNRVGFPHPDANYRACSQCNRTFSMESNVCALRNEIHQVRIRLDAVRGNIISRLNECNDNLETLERCLQQDTEMNAVLEDELANPSNEEKLAANAVSRKVILNVGGEKYSTTVNTLTRERNTFFTALFFKQRPIERDPVDNSIFIDRDGKLFQHILAYCRTRTVPLDVMSHKSLRQALIIEAEYFRVYGLIFILTEPERKLEEQRRITASFPDGTLEAGYKTTLTEFYGRSDRQWSLIYKASRDGFGATIFHRLCDNHGPTMTIIRSKNNYLFGGYTAAPWTSDGSYKEDRTTFLFTLTNPHDIPPTKYCLNDARITSTVYRNADYGPTFGGGFDLVVAGGSNANNLSYTNFPHSYIDTTGKGYKTFTGAKNFTTSDIEIYRLS